MSNCKKIFVSDLDGTLLGAGGRLSEYSRAALGALLLEGVAFTVASARAWGEIVPVLGDLPLVLPVIAINGAYITDYETGEHLVINDIEADLSRAIYQHVLDEGLRPFVVTHNGVEDCLYWDELVNAEMQWYHDILVVEKDKRIRKAEQLKKSLDEKVIAFAVMGLRERVTAVWDLLATEYPGCLENFLFENPYSPGHWWLTVHDERSCKSKAVAKLMEMTGHDLKDLTTFGDHINDIKMLEMAGIGVGMGNAEEEVKACADVIIGSNEEDAVVRYIQAY